MPYWLDPTGKSTYGIGICARCGCKHFLEDLHSDPNTPGLKVCLADLDDYDPYRLPARRTEDIALRFNRPDVDVSDLQPGAVSPAFALFGVIVADTTPEGNVNIRITESGSIRVKEVIEPIVDQ